MPEIFTSVLCIPGHWANDQELSHAIVDSSNCEYVVAAGMIMHVATGNSFNCKVVEREERMKQSFAVAGQVTGVTETFLDEVDTHRLVVYLSATMGSLLAAKQLAFAGAAILKAGGIGIKVETAGKAFQKDTWLNLITNFEVPDLYRLFVLNSIQMENGTLFSCGMHNLGLKDTIVSGISVQEAADLIRIFGFYQLVDKPVIVADQTFQPTVESPLFRITEERNPPYKGNDLFGNPFGIWRLTKA